MHDMQSIWFLSSLQHIIKYSLSIYLASIFDSAVRHAVFIDVMKVVRGASVEVLVALVPLS